MGSLKKSSLSYAILGILEKSIDGYVRMEDFAINSYDYAYGYDRSLSKSALSKAIKRLREKGYVEQSVLDQKIILKLTSEGGNFLKPDEFSKNDWDGKWRIVIFDIPESKRVIRNLFRRNLKKWEFKNLQKSVWISKRDVYLKLVKYIEELNLSQWVLVIETDKIGPQAMQVYDRT